MPRCDSERRPAGPPWGVALCLAQQKARSDSITDLWVGPLGPTITGPRKGLQALTPQRLKPPVPAILMSELKLRPTNLSQRIIAKLSIRQHLMDILGVRRMDQLQFLQPAHPVGLFGAQQVPLPGMHSQDFSCRRNLETLSGAAMRLQLELLYFLFCHQHYLVRNFFACGLSSKPARN